MSINRHAEAAAETPETCGPKNRRVEAARQLPMNLLVPQITFIDVHWATFGKTLTQKIRQLLICVHKWLKASKEIGNLRWWPGFATALWPLPPPEVSSFIHTHT